MVSDLELLTLIPTLLDVTVRLSQQKQTSSAKNRKAILSSPNSVLFTSLLLYALQVCLLKFLKKKKKKKSNL